MKLSAFKVWLINAKSAAKSTGSAGYLENIDEILAEEDLETNAEFYAKKILQELSNLIHSRNKPLKIVPSPGELYERLNPDKYFDKKNPEYMELLNDLKARKKKSQYEKESLTDISVENESIAEKKKSQDETIRLLSFQTPIEKVIPKIKEMNLDDNFKRQLYLYQIEHANEVYNAQLKLTSPEAPSTVESEQTKAEKIHSREISIAFNFLKNTQFLMCTTKWKVSRFGGCEIYDRQGNAINTVPKNMVRMMEIIDKAYRKDPTGTKSVWVYAFRELAKVGTKAARKPPKGLFSGKRDIATQQFYDRFIISLMQIDWQTTKKRTPSKRSAN